MDKPEISGIIAACSKHGRSAQLRYSVDVAANRVEYAVRRDGRPDAAYAHYADARERYDAICAEIEMVSSTRPSNDTRPRLRAEVKNSKL